ncbi:MAG: DUF4352 domain-containing protein [Clostridiales bacterium]|nr:DUF4352 domain-containing protein [Clostridiales bacterium]
MKRLKVLIICILGISLSGCMKEYPLNEAQTDIVAEYMASRLLENDKKFTPSLISYQEASEIDDIIHNDETMPDPTEIPVETEDNKADSSEVYPSDSTSDIQYTLSEVIGESNFDIQYTGYQLTGTYPEDESNLVFSLDPRAGYQLLVVDFTIENISDSDKTIDLSKASIQYQLDINVGTIYKPQLALLENNLQYIKLNVRSGDKIPAVLIFEVTKDIDMSDINLIVSRDARTEIVEIK